MSQQLIKLSYDQGYESVLVALGLEKRAFVGAAGQLAMKGVRWGGQQIAKAGQRKFTGVAGKTMDVAGGVPAQLGAGALDAGVNKAVTGATA
jgi:hypothetical protein